MKILGLHNMFPTDMVEYRNRWWVLAVPGLVSPIKGEAEVSVPSVSPHHSASPLASTGLMTNLTEYVMDKLDNCSCSNTTVGNSAENGK